MTRSTARRREDSPTDLGCPAATRFVVPLDDVEHPPGAPGSHSHGQGVPVQGQRPKEAAPAELADVWFPLLLRAAVPPASAGTSAETAVQHGWSAVFRQLESWEGGRRVARAAVLARLPDRPAAVMGSIGSGGYRPREEGAHRGRTTAITTDR
jgi:hypothetical protein